MLLKIIADRGLYCYLHLWEEILKPPEFSIRDLTENNSSILYSYNLIDNKYSRNFYTSNEPNISQFSKHLALSRMVFVSENYFISYLHSAVSHWPKKSFAFLCNVVPFPFEKMHDGIVARNKVGVFVRGFTRCQYKYS